MLNYADLGFHFYLIHLQELTKEKCEFTTGPLPQSPLPYVVSCLLHMLAISGLLNVLLFRWLSVELT